MGRSEPQKGKGFLRREVVEFALDQDVREEIQRQLLSLDEHPEDPQVHFNLGVLYYSQKRVPEAIQAYQQALQLNPEHRRAHKNLGEIYVVLGQEERAWFHAVEASRLGDRFLLELLERHGVPGRPSRRTPGDLDEGH